MSAEKILGEWNKKKFKPVYWLEGEENFTIDRLVDFAEHQILTDEEISFNLTVFYGRDAAWPEIVNACMRYPMFGERQVVIVKEAQFLRDVDKLENYIAKPLHSTIFIVAYKDKKLDKRLRLAKLLKEKAEVLTTKKLYDNQLPEWTQALVAEKGFTINQKALLLLVDHIGNDLSRISNEINKLALNLGERKNITEDDIEKFVGISKEYNPFELNRSIASKDLAKAVRIIQYFEANPKAAPIHYVLITLYNLFSKSYMIFGQNSRDEKTIAAAIGVNPYVIKDYMLTARNYGGDGIERSLLLLHQYNLRSVGVHDSGTSEGSLMKEMVVKIMMDA